MQSSVLHQRIFQSSDCILRYAAICSALLCFAFGSALLRSAVPMRLRTAVRRCALTVDFDADLAFIVAAIFVHLSSARVLAVIARRDVGDAQPVRHVDLISAVFCNSDVTRSSNTTSVHRRQLISHQAAITLTHDILNSDLVTVTAKVLLYPTNV